MGTCVIVAGTYRAGTSLLARFLHESGADMNPVPVQSDWPGWHPTGSYKDKILDGEGFCGWNEYFATRFMPKSGVWGIKSHRLLFTPGMMESLIEACPVNRKVLVWTTRDQVQSAKSWKALRPNLSLEAAMNQIGEQIASISKLYDRWPAADRWKVGFPDTANDPQGQLEEIAQFIGIPFSINACEHIRSDIPKWV